MTQPQIIVNPAAVAALTRQLSAAMDAYLAANHPVDYMTGMLATLNLAKRVALETARQSPAPPGYWRRAFVLTFLDMMTSETFDTQDPVLARLAGLPQAEFWGVIEDILEGLET